MIKTARPKGQMAAPRLSAGFTRRLQLALTLLVAVYMLLIGGTFDASLRYRVQLLNTVAAALLAVIWLGVRSRRGGGLAWTGLEWPLGMFALSQWLAWLTSAQPRLGLEWVASVTAWTAALIILCDVLRSGWPREDVINAVVLLGVIVTAQGLAEVGAWYAGWLAAGQWPPFTFRLNGLLGHANLTASFVVLLLPLVLVRAAGATSRTARIALGLLAAGMLVVLFFTSSRAGWLATAFGLTTLVGLLALRADGKMSFAGRRGRATALLRGLPRRERWLLSLGTLALAAAAAALLAAQSQHITHGPLLDSRSTFWGVAWRMFLAQPLTGSGPDLFPWFYSRWVPSPPDWFAPHAHSLILQVLGGSGLIGLAALLGLAAAGMQQLWRRWQAAEDRLLLAGLAAGLAGFAFQHLFDYLLGSIVTMFVVAVLLALALSTPAPALTRPRGVPPLVLAPALLVPLAVAAFALRGAALNDQGLTLASQGDWAGAAAAFERAAARDPGLTLYWEHAAYAYTRAGNMPAAMPLWQRAAEDDPYWSVLPATLGVLTSNPDELRAASELAGARSHLYALNEGVLAEAADDTAAATAAYQHALALRPASASALFWRQTALRETVLSEWQAARGVDTSALALGQKALTAGDSEPSLVHFQAALSENPTELGAYAGLAQAYQALGEVDRAERYRLAGMRVPVTALEQTLALRQLAGDWARARGDATAAANAYIEVFSVVNDYTAFGPGTYGYPHRAWYVFRRQALPADLVHQFARADITAEMDERFVWLAQWFAGQGERDTACVVAARVRREAAESRSGAYWEQACRP